MKPLRWLLSPVLAALLVGTPMPATALQNPTSATAPVSVVAVECVPANSSPMVEASLEPGATVSSARVYYRSARATSFSYVEMERHGDRLEACLPQVRPDTETLTYYVVTASGTGGPEQRSVEGRAVVVADPGLCGARRMASDCGSRLVSPAQPAAPVQFTAAASTDGISKGVIIASSAVLAGVGAFLIFHNKEPKSPSR